jgi:hypothetical protein
MHAYIHININIQLHKMWLCNFTHFKKSHFKITIAIVALRRLTGHYRRTVKA